MTAIRSIALHLVAHTTGQADAAALIDNIKDFQLAATRCLIGPKVEYPHMMQIFGFQQRSGRHRRPRALLFTL